MPKTNPPYCPCLGDALLKGIESKTRITNAMDGERRHCSSALDSKSVAFRRRLKFSIEIQNSKIYIPRFTLISIAIKKN